MSKPRLIIGIDSRMFVDADDANKVVEYVEKRFPDYEVTIIMDASFVQVLPPKEEESEAPVGAARQKHGLLRITKEAIVCRCGAAFNTNAQFQGHLGADQR